jgi:pimeloyl-ACP methyl ester carboxylesterase
MLTHDLKIWRNSLLYVDRRGRGGKLIVLGGGPGFSHDYLVPALAPLERRFELIYIDYPGCGKSRTAHPAASLEDTASAVVDALRAYVNSDPVDLLCHSFGSVALGSMLSSETAINFRKCVLANPSPHSRNLCDEAQIALLSRLSAEDVAFLEATLTGRDSRPEALMDRLLPYYCGRTRDLPSIKIELFLDAYLAISNTLGDFDFADAMASIPNRLYLFGSTDFIGPELFRDVLDSPGVAWKILEGGHFLAYDAEDELCAAVERFLDER